MTVHKVVTTCHDQCHIYTHCGVYVLITRTNGSWFQYKARVGAKTWKATTCKNCLKMKPIQRLPK